MKSSFFSFPFLLRWTKLSFSWCFPSPYSLHFFCFIPLVSFSLFLAHWGELTTVDCHVNQATCFVDSEQKSVTCLACRALAPMQIEKKKNQNITWSSCKFSRNSPSALGDDRQTWAMTLSSQTYLHVNVGPGCCEYTPSDTPVLRFLPVCNYLRLIPAALLTSRP